MTAGTATMSVGDFWTLSQDGSRRELIHGEIREMAPSGSGHGLIVVALTSPLARHVRQHQLGLVFGGETGFLVSRNPDTVLAPDIAFVTRDRIPSEGIPDRFWPGAPTLAIEVVSPSDTVYAVEEKTRDWLDAGTVAVWVVSPKLRAITVYSRATGPAVFESGQILNAGDVVPGFTMPVEEVLRF